MEIVAHTAGELRIAEIVSDEIVLHSSEDGLDLLGNVYYQGFDKLVLHKKNIHPDFFDLKTGIAGETLQKFSNYGMRLAIVGDFASEKSKALNDFIGESNKGKLVNFVSTLEEALN